MKVSLPHGDPAASVMVRQAARHEATAGAVTAPIIAVLAESAGVMLGGLRGVRIDLRARRTGLAR